MSEPLLDDWLLIYTCLIKFGGVLFKGFLVWASIFKGGSIEEEKFNAVFCSNFEACIWICFLSLSSLKNCSWFNWHFRSWKNKRSI